MNIFKVKRKEKKIRVKYHLRKEQGATGVEIVKGEEIFYYPLYIEFIHRRKQNKCKSLFLSFHKYEPTNLPYIYYNKFGVSTIEFNEEREKLINGDEPLERSFELDFMDLLICERKHAFSLFKLFKDIEDDDFTLSRLSEGYSYSLNKRAFDLYTEGLKELLLEEFKKSVPDYPIELLQLALPLYAYMDFFDLLVKVFNVTKVEKSSKDLIDFGFLLFSINEKIKSYMSITPFRNLELTIPIWVLDEHSKKLREFLENGVHPDKGTKDTFESIVEILLNNVEFRILEEVSSIKKWFINKG